MSIPGSGPEGSGRRTRRAGPTLAGLALLVAGLLGTARAPGAREVIARLGPLTVTATPLRPGPSGTLTASVQVSTSGQPSDRLDAATSADGAPVGIYHQRVSIGEIPELTDCGGDIAPPDVVDRWLHYGPLLVPGRSGGPSPPANATLTVQPVTALPSGGTLAITLYFAQAGAVTLRLPVGGS